MKLHSRIFTTTNNVTFLKNKIQHQASFITQDYACNGQDNNQCNNCNDQQNNQALNNEKASNIVQFIMQECKKQRSIKHFCVVVYRIDISLQPFIQEIQSQSEKDQKVCTININRYDYSSRKICSINQLSKQSRNQKTSSIVNNADKQTNHQNQIVTYVVDCLLKGTQEQQNIRIYILPFAKASHNQTKKYQSSQKNYTESNDLQISHRFIHQNISIFQLLKEYLSLNSSSESKVTYNFDKKALTNQIAKYLYERSVSNFQIFLKYEESVYEDEKIIEKLSEIQVPEEWLENKQYRELKKEIYVMKYAEGKEEKELKERQNEFAKTINILEQILSLPCSGYESIGIDTLKKIKGEHIQEKINEIKELQNMNYSLDLRLGILAEKKISYEQKHKDQLDRQSRELYQLKEQIVNLKHTNSIDDQDFNHIIYHKSTHKPTPKGTTTKATTNQASLKEVNVHANLMVKSILRNVDHNVKRMETDYSEYDKDKGVSTKKIIQPDRASEFKNNQRRRTNVINLAGEAKINILDKAQARKDYQEAISKVEFEMEKEFETKRNKYAETVKELTLFLKSFNEELI